MFIYYTSYRTIPEELKKWKDLLNIKIKGITTVDVKMEGAATYKNGRVNKIKKWKG